MHFNWMGQFWVFHIRVCGLCWSFSVPWNLVRFLTVRVQPPNSKLEPLASVAIFLVTIRDRILGFSREHMIPAQFAPEIPPLWGGAPPVPWGLGCSLPLLWAHCHFFLVTALSHICYYWMQPSTDQFTTFPHFSSSVEPNLYLVNTVTSIEFFIQTALARLWAGGQKKANPSALSTEVRSPREGRRPSVCSLGFPPPLILGSSYLERFSRDLWDAISRHSDRRLYPRVGVMCLHIGSPLSSAKMIQLVQTPSFCWVLFT